MKRILPTIIVSLLLSCDNNDKGHIVTFNKFVEGVIYSDIDAVRRVSTETTSSMVEQLIKNKKMRGQSHVINEMAYLATCKSKIQHNIVLLADSISSDGLMAWIWFKTNDEAEKMVAPLIQVGNQWFVDIPVLDLGCN